MFTAKLWIAVVIVAVVGDFEPAGDVP